MIADFNVYGGDDKTAGLLEEKLKTGSIGDPAGGSLLADKQYALNISKLNACCPTLLSI